MLTTTAPTPASQLIMRGGHSEPPGGDVDAALPSDRFPNGLNLGELSYISAGFHTNAMESCLDPSLGAEPSGASSPPALFAQRRLSYNKRLLQPSDDLPILSAETHDDAAAIEKTRAGVAARQQSGEIVLGVLLEDAAKPSDQVPSSARSAGKKRAWAASQWSDEEAGSKRSRGRPRLDTQDENAGDVSAFHAGQTTSDKSKRRRTQIRLAQRAYRLRKETTISSLKTRVAELERTIEHMHSSYLDLNDAAIRSGIVALRPELAAALNQTTQRFIALANGQTSAGRGTEASNEEHEAEEPAQPAPRQAKRTRRARARAAPEPVEASTDIPAQAELQRPPGPDADDAEGEPVQTTREAAQAEWGAIVPNNYLQLQVAVPDLSDWAPNVAFPGQTLSPPTPPLRAPDSTTIYEPTFARRLLRAALEGAYKLLMDPLASTQRRDEVFRFCFSFGHAGEVLARTSRLLQMLNGSLGANAWPNPRPRVGPDDELVDGYFASVDGPSLTWDPNEALLPDLNSDGMKRTAIAEWGAEGGELLDVEGVQAHLAQRGVRVDGLLPPGEVNLLVEEAAGVGSLPGSLAHGSAGSTSVPSSSSPITPLDATQTMEQPRAFDVSDLVGAWDAKASGLGSFTSFFTQVKGPTRKPPYGPSAELNLDPWEGSPTKDLDAWPQVTLGQKQAPSRVISSSVLLRGGCLSLLTCVLLTQSSDSRHGCLLGPGAWLSAGRH